MDRHALAILIPVIAVTFSGLIAFSFTRLGRAVAKRLEGGGDDEIHGRMAAYESELMRLRSEVAGAHQRLDYAERMLARSSVRGELSEPR
jgi:hypothetical protein